MKHENDVHLGFSLICSWIFPNVSVGLHQDMKAWRSWLISSILNQIFTPRSLCKEFLYIFVHSEEMFRCSNGSRCWWWNNLVHVLWSNVFVLLKQPEYAGLIESCPSDDQKYSGIEVGANGEYGATYDVFTVEYGITSLVDKKTLLQPGDRVNS